jgi:hypothetical protein
MKNRIGNLIEIDWLNDLHDLQPDGVKLPYNYGHLKSSLLKFGFALPFAVWHDGEKYLCIDGHTRKEVLTELMADGHKVPKLLKAFEVEAADKKEAIEILVQVYNQKHNPFNSELLEEWLEIEEVEVSMDGVNVNIQDIGVNLDNEKFGTDFSLPDGDKAPFQQMTFTLADEQAEQIKNAITDIKETQEYKYCETMGNENSNGNALYLIVMQWAEQKK